MTKRHSFIKPIKKPMPAISPLSYGFIKVNAFSAREALPVDTASVRIYEAGEVFPPVLVKSLVTDSDGSTQNIAVETKLDDKNGIAGSRYSVFDIHISAYGYGDIFYRNVTVYSDSLTLQNVNLLPLSENESDSSYPYKEYRVYE